MTTRTKITGWIAKAVKIFLPEATHISCPTTLPSSLFDSSVSGRMCLIAAHALRSSVPAFCHVAIKIMMMMRAKKCEEKDENQKRETNRKEFTCMFMALMAYQSCAATNQRFKDSHVSHSILTDSSPIPATPRAQMTLALWVSTPMSIVSW